MTPTKPAPGVICKRCVESGSGHQSKAVEYVDGEPLCMFCRDNDPCPGCLMRLAQLKDQPPPQPVKARKTKTSREALGTKPRLAPPAKIHAVEPIPPEEPVAPETTETPAKLEKCRFGETPAHVCLTEGCKNHRHTNDTTGYCKPCKVDRGYAYANGVARDVAYTRKAPRTKNAVDEEFVTQLLTLLNQDQRVRGLLDLYDGKSGVELTQTQKLFLLQRAVTTAVA